MISVFDLADVFIGSIDVPTTFFTASFFGVIDDMNMIGRINLATNNANGGEVIDNISFGVTTLVMPEPGTLALFLVGLAVLFLTRRRRAP